MFGKCIEVAITVSGVIPDSKIVYGLYLPDKPRETWDQEWRTAIDPAFTHFWVEKENLIIDFAASQFGEKPDIITDYSDIRYVKVGYYDKNKDTTFPVVSDPKIMWETLDKENNFVVVVWKNPYYNVPP